MKQKDKVLVKLCEASLADYEQFREAHQDQVDIDELMIHVDELHAASKAILHMIRQG